jgi:hypothetical protein
MLLLLMTCCCCPPCADDDNDCIPVLLDLDVPLRPRGPTTLGCYQGEAFETSCSIASVNVWDNLFLGFMFQAMTWVQNPEKCFDFSESLESQRAATARHNLEPWGHVEFAGPLW